MSRSIGISKEHGLNVTMLTCWQCGEDTGELALLGSCSKLECRQCGAIVFGSRMEPCPKCGAGKDGSRYAAHFDVIETNAEAPRKMQGGLCPKCEKARKDVDLEVSKGGIYWKCKKCGSAGAIKRDTPIAKHVREQMKIEPPNPCGVEFDEKTCPMCSENKVTE